MAADRPMVQLNCGAIPEALVESELCGHEPATLQSKMAKLGIQRARFV